MRKLFVCLTVLSALSAPAGGAAQDPARSPQRFQSGIDLIAIDVTAVDSQGRPVDDLRARDFTVKVDGKTRDVVSAELVKVDRGQPAPVERAQSRRSSRRTPPCPPPAALRSASIRR